MEISHKDLLKIYETADLCRQFEEVVYSKIEDNIINIPVYLSAGQEYISASLACALNKLSITKLQIFIQHRGHSTYLSFGGSMIKLVDELLGKETGCSYGMGGSASIQSLEANRSENLNCSHNILVAGQHFLPLP